MTREGTEVFYGVDAVMRTVLQFLYQTDDKIDACVDYTRPSLAIDIVILKKAFLDAKKRGVKLRYATEITKDNISYCKQMMTMVDELRHLDGIKGNFYISETGYLAPSTFHEAGKPAEQIIYSNVKEIIEHQKYVFETLWSKTIPAEQRIREIEEGIEAEFYEVITDNEKASQILVDMTKSTKREALIFLPNDKALVRIDRLGIIDSLIKASQNGANVKIICQLSEENTEIQKKISENAPDIIILDGNSSPYGMYIVDRKKFLRAELKRPGAEKFSDAIGLVVYSNRRTTVDSFESVFELLWKERMLVEELKKADRMQKEFISIAAHELKTPIQAILGMSGLLKYYPERTDQVAEVIYSNSIQFTNQGYIFLNIVTDNDIKEVIVTVRDTGTGINPEILPRLFSKFVTRSQKGTGLGLFISKSIIEAHGGRIWAESNVLDGQGTIFCFALPLEIKDSVGKGKGK
jgi:two-component system, OmpR family, sensor histidine kinase VicK